MNEYKIIYNATEYPANPYTVVELTSDATISYHKSDVEARAAIREYASLTEADVERSRKVVDQWIKDNVQPRGYRPKTALKDELQPTEKGLAELHTITTYSAVAGAVAIAVAGVMPPLGIIAFPVATFVAKWLWKKGKEEGRKEERR
jgi:hypothetical protein